jgi:hypothetical protein
MTLRSDLIPVVDETRTLVEDLGLRLHTVATRKRTWAGAEIGLGAATDVDATLDPVPKVKEPSPRLVAAAPGTYESGDRIVAKISASYTKAQLDGGTLGAAEEWHILIDGDPYRVVAVDERAFEWRLHCRKLTGR